MSYQAGLTLDQERIAYHIRKKFGAPVIYGDQENVMLYLEEEIENDVTFRETEQSVVKFRVNKEICQARPYAGCFLDMFHAACLPLKFSNLKNPGLYSHLH